MNEALKKRLDSWTDLPWQRKPNNKQQPPPFVGFSDGYQISIYMLTLSGLFTLKIPKYWFSQPHFMWIFAKKMPKSDQMNRKIFDMRDNPRYTNVTRPRKKSSQQIFGRKNPWGMSYKVKEVLMRHWGAGFGLFRWGYRGAFFFPITDPWNEGYISLHSP